jgi:hypothetical protein
MFLVGTEISGCGPQPLVLFPVLAQLPGIVTASLEPCLSLGSWLPEVLTICNLVLEPTTLYCVSQRH